MEKNTDIMEMGNIKESIEKSDKDIVEMFGADFQREVIEIRNHLKLTRNFVESVIGGVHKNAILEGPPGLGKSHVVAQALKAAGKVERKDYYIVKGHVTPINLFVLLGLFRNSGQVLVLDDCDDVFQSDLGFNMLKAALDPDNRYVSYQSQRIPIINGVPMGDFEYNGTLIICTNVSMVAKGRSRRSQHMSAVLSRAVVWPMELDTPQSKFAQIFNMTITEDYLSLDERTKLDRNQKIELLQFIWMNLRSIKDLDLRLPQKIAAEIKVNKNWAEICKIMLRINDVN